MNLRILIALSLVALVALINRTVQAIPPFSGTIFIDPDIITSSDPTTFLGSPYAGRGMRWMYDRRVNDWIYVNAYLFNTSFDDGLTSEIQVNPEFGSMAAASIEALTYGTIIGRLPTALRADAQTVWIHQGTQPFGGGNNNLLIHTGQADLYMADGILEETLVHEAAHTSLDADHASAPGWLSAQAADSEFISTYARDFSNREDIAESFLPYLAVQYRMDRISQSLANTILQTIPNRMDYFDSQLLDMYPIVIPDPAADFDGDGDKDGNDFLAWQRGESTNPLSQSDLADWQAQLGTVASLITSDSAAIPEPTTGIMLLVGMATMLTGSRKFVSKRLAFYRSWRSHGL
jgi:hypothetical protein